MLFFYKTKELFIENLRKDVFYKTIVKYCPNSLYVRLEDDLINDQNTGYKLYFDIKPNLIRAQLATQFLLYFLSISYHPLSLLTECVVGFG